MSKIQAIKGVLKTFVSLSKEDFQEMDHKLLRIGIGVVGFILMAIFWLLFLRNILPF
jgi:hypothetical protein